MCFERESRTLRVEFEITGSMIGDDTVLDEENLKGAILNEFNAEDAASYSCNRDIDTKVSNLRVKNQTATTLDRATEALTRIIHHSEAGIHILDADRLALRQFMEDARKGAGK